MTDARITQVVTESLSYPTPDARVTQVVVELLSSAVVSARITQQVVELLSENLVVLGGERVELFIWMPV
jgi:hypothetical protein